MTSSTGQPSLQVPRLLLAVLPLLAACESSRPLGPCVGINGVQRADRRYEYSTRNVVLGIVFVEMVIPPVVVVLSNLKCPVEAIPAPHPAGEVSP